MFGFVFVSRCVFAAPSHLTSQCLTSEQLGGWKKGCDCTSDACSTYHSMLCLPLPVRKLCYCRLPQSKTSVPTVLHPHRLPTATRSNRLARSRRCTHPEPHPEPPQRFTFPTRGRKAGRDFAARARLISKDKRLHTRNRHLRNHR